MNPPKELEETIKEAREKFLPDGYTTEEAAEFRKTIFEEQIVPMLTKAYEAGYKNCEKTLINFYEKEQG